MSGKVRTYELEACPVHGTEYMSGGHCRKLVEQTDTHRRYCHMEESVTAVDLRDVEPLVAAAHASLARLGAIGWHDTKLAAALEPFASTGGER